MLRKKKLLRFCSVCNHTKGNILHSQGFRLPEQSNLPDIYDVVECENCGFCFADTSATQNDYDRYYNKMSKYEDKNTGTGTGLSIFDKQRMEEVVGLLSHYIEKKTNSIVDIGCANGGMLTCFSEKKFYNLTGVDVSRKCVENVNKLGFDGFFGGIFTLDNIKNMQFDCIIVSHVMEHIKDLQDAVSNILSLINNNGLLYIEVPDASRYHQHYFVPYYYFDCEHINHFNISSLKNLFLIPFLECIYFEEKSIAASDNKDYPVLRAIFKKTSLKKIKLPFKKNEDVKFSINKYITLSQINSSFNKLNCLIETYEPIFVWGAGMYTLRLLQDSKLSQCNIKFFIDKDSNKQGNNINTIVITTSEILNTYKNTPIVIASAIHGAAIVEEILLIDGDSKRKIIIL